MKSKPQNNGESTPVDDDAVANGMCSLNDLLHLVESGHFYEDHDDSMAVLGRAKNGFEAVRTALYAYREAQDFGRTKATDENGAWRTAHDALAAHGRARIAKRFPAELQALWHDYCLALDKATTSAVCACSCHVYQEHKR